MAAQLGAAGVGTCTSKRTSKGGAAGAPAVGLDRPNRASEHVHDRSAGHGMLAMQAWPVRKGSMCQAGPGDRHQTSD